MIVIKNFNFEPIDFYVYVHRKLSNGEVFYVGKGKKRRALSVTDRSKFHRRVAEKYGVVVEIVQHGLQEWYAFELEKDLISYYGRKQLNTGCLVNLTDGGEGEAGKIYSKEHLERMSKTTKKLFEENPQRRSKNKEMLLEVRNSEIFKKNHRKFLESVSKRVVMDEVVCFKSLSDASKYLSNCPRKEASRIRKCCELRYGYLTVKGHIFRYVDSDKDEFYSKRECFIKARKENRKFKNHCRGLP